ncbi:MAG: hypothetical protein WCF84_17765 [Anaerolineae bacterium]
MSLDIVALLNDLNESRVDAVRRQAIEQLAGLPPEDRIVRAFVGARLFDSDSAVRDIAASALQSPAVQAFLAGHPDLQQQATEALQFQPPAPVDIQALIRQEFNRRRLEQVRMSYIIFGLLVVLFIVMWVQVQPWAPLAFVLTFGLVLGYLLFTWQNWRCPKCKGHFWFGPRRIDPWQVRRPVACPHCGTPMRS